MAKSPRWMINERIIREGDTMYYTFDIAWWYKPVICAMNLLDRLAQWLIRFGNNG